VRAFVNAAAFIRGLQLIQSYFSNEVEFRCGHHSSPVECKELAGKRTPEYEGIVSIDGDPHAGIIEHADRVVFQSLNPTELDVGRRAKVQPDPCVSESPHHLGGRAGGDPVLDFVEFQKLHRSPDIVRGSPFAHMRLKTKTGRSGAAVDQRERFYRLRSFISGEVRRFEDPKFEKGSENNRCARAGAMSASPLAAAARPHLKEAARARGRIGKDRSATDSRCFMAKALPDRVRLEIQELCASFLRQKLLSFERYSPTATRVSSVGRA
jgi:hypothetical protein